MLIPRSLIYSYCPRLTLSHSPRLRTLTLAHCPPPSLPLPPPEDPHPRALPPPPLRHPLELSPLPPRGAHSPLGALSCRRSCLAPSPLLPLPSLDWPHHFPRPHLPLLIHLPTPSLPLGWVSCRRSCPAPSAWRWLSGPAPHHAVSETGGKCRWGGRTLSWMDSAPHHAVRAPPGSHAPKAAGLWPLLPRLQPHS